MVADPREGPRLAGEARIGPPRRLFRALLALQLVWGSVYILRTGFLLGGEPVFCLWDDAMISMRYGRNLAEGHGLVWNPGEEPVQGFSNPAVTLLMAALHLAPLSPERMSLPVQLVELALLCASLALVWRLATRLLPDRPLAAPMAALAWIACAPVQIWALQGADTGFVGAWLLACLVLLAAGGNERWRARLPVLLALGVTIRLDAGIFAVALIAASLFHPGRRPLLALAALAAVCGAMLGLGWLYYGDPLPNTYYLKATGSPREIVLRTGLAQLGARLPGLAPALVLATISAWRRRGDPRFLALAAVVAAGFAYDVWTGGDWIIDHGSRYSVPGLAPLLILAVDGALLALAAFAPRARAAAAYAAAAALGVAASPAATRVEWFVPWAPTMYHATNLENFLLGTYLRAWTRPETTIGVHWGGVPAYFAERPAIDLLGRSDRYIARLVVDRFLPGHSKWDPDYTLHARRPDLILGAGRGLPERPDFRVLYLEARSREGVVFFVRRESVPKLLDDRIAFSDLWTGRPLDRAEALRPAIPPQNADGEGGAPGPAPERAPPRD